MPSVQITVNEGIYEEIPQCAYTVTLGNIYHRKGPRYTFGQIQCGCSQVYMEY